MKDIKILGLDCFKFKILAQNAKQAAEELGLECGIEKVTDINEILRFRSVMKIPALVVDGQVKVTRRAASVDEIKKLLI